jgi:type IV pilus assembly protein PilC
MFGRNASELADSYRAFSELEGAGFSLVQTFEHYQATLRGPGERTHAERVLSLLKRGKGLADSLAAAGGFRYFDVALIRVGETAGQLVELTRALSERYVLQAETEAQVRSAMMKPAVTLMIALFIAPSISLAKGDIGMGEYAIRSAGVLALLAFATYRGLRWFERARLDPSRAAAMDAFVVGFPVLGALARALSLERYCACLGLCLRSGLPLPQSLEIAAGAVSDGALQAASSRIRAQVEKGRAIGEAFTAAGYFDATVPLQIATGALSGKLPETLERLAAGYRQQIADRFKWLAEWVPRAAYACVAVFMVYWIFANYPRLPE